MAALKAADKDNNGFSSIPSVIAARSQQLSVYRVHHRFVEGLADMLAVSLIVLGIGSLQVCLLLRIRTHSKPGALRDGEEVRA